ncbi:MAG TPA: hypothetical protein VLC91_09800 [Spongiibacteraceae bacterium]|nr:hypothetical protein [Spongiibacteraceae bacterium]
MARNNAKLKRSHIRMWMVAVNKEFKREAKRCAFCSPLFAAAARTAYRWASLNLLIFILALAARQSFAQVADELSGSWVLQVENLQHEVISTANVRFADTEGSSCLGGNWEQVMIDAPKSSDAKFFPISDKLSYIFEGGILTIGRNEICDAYLHLSGQLNNGAVAGKYFQFGWGRKQLGYFSLKRSSK